MISPLAPEPADPRIRGRLREAIELMVYEGLVRKAAAERAGMTDHSLRCALNRDHVRAFRTSLFRAMVNAEAERSVAVMVQLRDTSSSEHVRLEAAKQLAALGGVKPPETPKNTRPDAIPGYIIDLTPTEVIEGQPQPHQARRILLIPNDKAGDAQDEAPALDLDFETTSSDFP